MMAAVGPRGQGLLTCCSLRSPEASKLFVWNLDCGWGWEDERGKNIWVEWGGDNWAEGQWPPGL